MGIVQRLVNLLGGSDSDDAAGGGMVQVASVRPYQLPMLQEVLERSGIACEVVDELAHGTWESKSVVSVARSDAERAGEVLWDFHAT